MSTVIGIRREDKNKWERRAPLTPQHIEKLTRKGIEVRIQPSDIRAYSDQEYRKAKAIVQDDLSECSLVLAVKEIPISLLQPKKTYVFFSHVIKGQAHNMPLLRKIMELECNLIDYEKIVDEKGRRLVFFGRHAGMAGMVDSLWALGKKLMGEGIENPFAELKLTHQYKDLPEIKKAIKRVGAQIKKQGLSEALGPLVVGFAGYGNVSQGAQEIFDLLPHRLFSPKQLLDGTDLKKRNSIVKVVFHEHHMAKPIDPKTNFQLREYYEHPERYQENFYQFVPKLTLLINAIYWSKQYPRLVTIEQMQQLFSQDQPPRLRVIGDISCDIGGAIECNVQCTDPGEPVYVYQLPEKKPILGVHGNGPAILAVDHLPCELPIEASFDFGKVLMPFVPSIARCNFDQTFEQLMLPTPIKKAVIVHRGKLTPDYEYLSNFL